MYGGFRGGPHLGHLMPRDASLSDSYKSDRWRFSCLAVFVHWENYTSNSSHIEWDIIMMTVFLSILNQMEFYLVQNRKENCHYDHIPFHEKGNENIVFSVYMPRYFSHVATLYSEVSFQIPLAEGAYPSSKFKNTWNSEFCVQNYFQYHLR